MLGNRNKKSITEQVSVSTRVLSTVLVLPALLSLLIMLVYAAIYHDSVSRMETVATLKPIVGTGIAEQVWSAVAGRQAFEKCGAYQSIDTVNATLEQLVADGDRSTRLELEVARRTMDTLLGYVQMIDQNMQTGVPIVQSEVTLEEVRDVATLVDSMLEDYITKEIDSAAVINAKLTQVVLLTAVSEVLILVAAMILAQRTRVKMTRYIHEPIERLEHFAGMMADGNLQARVPHTDVLELENLTDRVNIMADHLESLIAQNKQEQENLKKSELRTLQAQINPHFLYNTLDAIIWQAEARNSDEVIHLTRALSDFFRISLSSGADWIPISQEIKHLAGYLSIQKIRYRDILNYEINVPDEIGEVYILKLLLQPLVENALYHGIKFKRGGGRISVVGWQEGELLHFLVKDTGKGMTRQQLDEVLACMRGEKPPSAASNAKGGGGFGLSNVDLRIRLYYNQEQGLQIESGPEGTTVSFCVPIKRREDVLDD